MIPISKPFVGIEEQNAVMSVLESGMLVQGERTRELENRFSALCGTKHAIAVNSGTAALHIALLANGIGPGDEVITSPFTFIASPNSILYAGATPIFADIEESFFNIAPEKIAQAVTPRTRAIMPVHLYGQMCDMDAIQSIAKEHGLIIIEDAAQAVGATFKGRKAGTFGTGVFSLYATKNVMSAEGGIVTTDDDDVAEKCRLLRNQGMKRRYHYEMLGYNYRLSDIFAAIGLAQMDRLPQFAAQRAANAAILSERLTSVITPQLNPDCEHVWHQYTVRVRSQRDRDSAVKRLAEAGVGTGIFYPVPAHKHDYMRALVGDLSFPVAERTALEVFSLPVHPLLSSADLEKIVEEVNRL